MRLYRLTKPELSSKSRVKYNNTRGYVVGWVSLFTCLQIFRNHRQDIHMDKTYHLNHLDMPEVYILQLYTVYNYILISKSKSFETYRWKEKHSELSIVTIPKERCRVNILRFFKRSLSLCVMCIWLIRSFDLRVQCIYEERIVCGRGSQPYRQAGYNTCLKMWVCIVCSSLGRSFTLRSHSENVKIDPHDRAAPGCFAGCWFVICQIQAEHLCDVTAQGFEGENFIDPWTTRACKNIEMPIKWSYLRPD